jgi:hypothetical protein
MKLSLEEKDMVKKIVEYYDEELTGTRALQFEHFIQSLSPEKCFFIYNPIPKNCRYLIFNDSYRNHNANFKLGLRLATILFLLDMLEKERLIYMIKLKKKNSPTIVEDCKGNRYNKDEYSAAFNNEPITSETFLDFLNRYSNTIILPSNSLISFIEKDFKTVEESYNDESLEKVKEGLETARVDLKYSKRAICISIFALAANIIVGIIQIWLSTRANTLP